MEQDAGTRLDRTAEEIRSLIGIPEREETVNPYRPGEIARDLKITFRPVPESYEHREVLDFHRELRDELMECGVNVVDWTDALQPADGWFSDMVGWQTIRGDIDAVINVDQEHSFLRRALLSLSDTVYEYAFRTPDRDVREILTLTSWAEYLPKHYVQNPFNTQIITLKPLDAEFIEDDVSYERKISTGLSHLINTMSEFVIGVSPDEFALINMNMSDALYPREELKPFLREALIPKTCASIRPPLLTQFERSTFSPDDTAGVDRLVDLGNRLEGTELFPRGTKFNDLIDRTSRRDVLDRYLEGRTGVSYGFIAYIESPQYDGDVEVSKRKWDQLSAIDGRNPDVFRRTEAGRWYVRLEIGGDVRYKQVPDLWVMTSRSGCDKTDLDPNRDVVRIGVKQGALQFQSPEGVDLDRKDVRPSFDTYVIVANAVATALYFPELVAGGAPMLHFHGYPDPSWFRDGEGYTGAHNPSVSCGTVEAALLNYTGIGDLAETLTDRARLLCVVEPDHGVNILGTDLEYVVSRIREGCAKDQLQLGGKFLGDLQ
jgi:hypothetical protein